MGKITALSTLSAYFPAFNEVTLLKLKVRVDFVKELVLYQHKNSSINEYIFNFFTIYLFPVLCNSRQLVYLIFIKLLAWIEVIIWSVVQLNLALKIAFGWAIFSPKATRSFFASIQVEGWWAYFTFRQAASSERISCR